MFLDERSSLQMPAPVSAKYKYLLSLDNLTPSTMSLPWASLMISPPSILSNVPSLSPVQIAPVDSSTSRSSGYLSVSLIMTVTLSSDLSSYRFGLQSMNRARGLGFGLKFGIGITKYIKTPSSRPMTDSLSMLAIKYLGDQKCYGQALGDDYKLYCMHHHSLPLWYQGECTTPFIATKPSVPRAQRFKLYSIYWPQKNEKSAEFEKGDQKVHLQALKISKAIDEQEKLSRGPRIRVRALSNIPAKLPNRPVTNMISRSTHQLLEMSRQKVLTPQSKSIVDRLFIKYPKGLSPDNRDKYGFRNWELTQSQYLQKDDNTAGTASTSFTRHTKTRGFSRSKRIDLSRPENFNPGPGAYRVVRYLDHMRNLRKRSRSHSKQ